MDIEKLKPWNWFKHEDSANTLSRQVPVTRGQGGAPADSLMRLHQEMDRCFDELSSSFGFPSLSTRLGGGDRALAPLSNFYRPQIDVSADNNSYDIKLDVPGMTESDLSIEVRDDVLMIRGEKQERSEDKDKHYYRVERSYGAFQRTLALPDDANTDEIGARLEKGVLRLEIPRRENAAQNVRRIEISS
jgi:HSP20 family protein